MLARPPGANLHGDITKIRLQEMAIYAKLEAS